MKKILASLFACYFLIPASYGQNSEHIRPSSIGISFFFNDFVTASRIRNSSLSSVLAQKKIAKFSEMSPGLAVSYFKGLTEHIDFAGTLAGSFVNYPLPGHTFYGDHFLLEADASVQLKMTGEQYWVQPYFSAGIGASTYKVYYGAFIPVGVGLKINFFDEAALFFNSQYRIPVTTETSNYHFFHSIGIAGIVGKKKEQPVKVVEIPQETPKDTDGDGITDDKDKCPDVPGVAKYDGCPVPDTDKDGVNDDNDKCPAVPGLARYEGCPVPDTDKDGINDEEDKCKDVPGVARYQGCPVPDSDGDGVNDEEDKCPQLVGTKENQGCPEIKDEVVSKVNYAAQNILFATGSAKLLAKSNKGLNEVAKILQDNPDLKIDIDGHTDNVGNDAFNQTLSENRANAVKSYFVSKGISESRITATGYGEQKPIADNNTAAGKTKNRRVEMKLGY
ncbi:MAG: OmpA family protein [Bacteroidota bacterium]|nr:OmpA family protein [Bacteroidota bacterium]